MPPSIEYGDYLQLDRILGSQQPESDRTGKPAHDEMLFIVTHQAYELWFKQILFEIQSVMHLLERPSLNDNSPDLQLIVHRLSRVVTILKLLVQQIEVMETMTPMDFLDFRDMLRPASGFQSWQFKLIEAKLGLRFEDRYGKEYYISQLSNEKAEVIRSAETERSILELVNEWLERMPFFNESSNWSSFQTTATIAPLFDAGPEEGGKKFWAVYYECYCNSLDPSEQANIASFNEVFWEKKSDGVSFTKRSLSPRASRAALFIMLYRGYPILQLPFQLLQVLLETDEQLSIWRYRHMSMVQRMIGTRIGTGGSTGRNYLKGALDAHEIFRPLAGLTSFLIERHRLPSLPVEMERRLGFERR